MKAAIFHRPFDITTEEVEIPEIGDDGALIKIKACGICGSDLHMYKLDLYTEKLTRPTSKGGVPGHEFAGDVEKVGKNVQGIQPGDRIAAVSRGGGIAEYNSLTAFPGMNIVKIPGDVSYEEACTLEPLANSLHATLKGRPAPGETAVVYGTGIIGLGIVQCLKSLDLGLNRIIAVDVSERRLKIAEQLGADATINAAESNPEEEIEKIVGLAPLMFYPEDSTPQVDIVYDCVGYVKARPEAAVLQQALNLVKEMTGRVVVHGLFEEVLPLDLSPFVMKQVELLGSFGFLPDEMTQAMELIGTGKVSRKQVISHEFPLDQAKEAFDMQCDVENSVKVIVKP